MEIEMKVRTYPDHGECVILRTKKGREQYETTIGNNTSFTIMIERIAGELKRHIAWYEKRND